MPNVPESYVHRIGRTGRAGASGIAIAFCDAEEKEYLRDIEKLIGKKIPVIDNHGYPLMNHNVEKAPQRQQRPPRNHSQNRNASQKKEGNKSGGGAQSNSGAKPNSSNPNKKKWFGKRKFTAS